ncbi:MAG: hypothetical protein ACYTG2_16860 [Planctomycetota bacterium]
MPGNNDAPRYTSASTLHSLWQEYRIYDDRLELDTLFGALEVPFEAIETLEVRPSDLKQLVTKGDLQLKGFRPALKLDWANFQEHVVLDKSEGCVRRILFTPDDIEEFLDAFEEARKEYAAHGG